MKLGILFVLLSSVSLSHIWQEMNPKPGMRATMFQLEAEAKVLKRFISEKRDLPGFQDSIPDMCTTQATDPDEITQDFTVFASLNQKLRKEVFQAKNPKPVFNRYIVSCVKCHEAHCPGPINRIMKLKIE